MAKQDLKLQLKKITDKYIISDSIKKMIEIATKDYSEKQLKDSINVTTLTIFKLKMDNYIPNTTRNQYIDDVICAAVLHNLCLDYKKSLENTKEFVTKAPKTLCILNDINKENTLYLDTSIQNICIIINGILGSNTPIANWIVQINNPGYKVVMACQDYYLYDEWHKIFNNETK